MYFLIAFANDYKMIDTYLLAPMTKIYYHFRVQCEKIMVVIYGHIDNDTPDMDKSVTICIWRIVHQQIFSTDIR